MKHLTIIYLTLCLFANEIVFAKGISIGPTVNTGTFGLGVGASGVYDFSSKLSAAGSLNYSRYLGALGVIEATAEGHYSFQVANKLKAYPLAGVSIYRVSYSDSVFNASDNYSSGTAFGFNIGGGGRYELTKSIDLMAEVKSGVGGYGGNFRLKFGALWNI